VTVKVTATYHGGFAATVEARGHRVEVDEPLESGGGDAGFMPTELLFAALASCFALALGHAARKRELELPGLRVEVTAERPGRELRYDRVLVSASAGVPLDELSALVEKAVRFCWVSNTLALTPEIEYRAVEDR
jgi:putative redox protein